MARKLLSTIAHSIWAMSLCLALVGCATTNSFVAPETTLKRGGTIMMMSMSRDPRGIAARMSGALVIRGFDVREGEVGRTVTRPTGSGSETYRVTAAGHIFRLTYSLGDGASSFSCSLINANTGKSEASVSKAGAFSVQGVIDECADVVVRAAK